MNPPDKTGVLVVGGGNAAMCAAIEAAHRGADVVVLECAPRDMRGGNTRHTRNFRAMHTAPTETLAGSYTQEEYWNDLHRVTGGNTDEGLARLMISESEDLLAWLPAAGVHFQQALSGTLSLGRTNAFFLGGGKALLNAQYREAESSGVQVFYDCEVTDFDINDGQFRSATVSQQGRPHTIRADAVVLASGGFQANEGWMREVWGNAADDFIIRGTPYNTGTVIKAMMRHGAATVGEPSQCHAVAVDARAPKYDGGIVSRLDCVCFSIVVNRDAERFHDEGEDFWPKRYAIWGRLVAQQPGQIAYAVIDSKVTGNFMPSVFPSIEAATLEGLADLISVDSDRLRQTVDEFNRSIVPGSYDPDELDDCQTAGLSPPKSHWALPIDTGPYFAYPLRPGITFTYLSLAVDDSARVRFERSGVSGNIFAAGEIMAGNILGQGYCAGTGMAIGGVFGRIAGRGASTVAQR